MGDFYRIAGAIINKYHPTINMAGATVELARSLRENAQQPNVIKTRVENENLHTRNAQRWAVLNSEHLPDFPVLDVGILQNITVGVYQLGLAPSYIQDKFHREEREELQLEMLRDANRIPEPGFLRVRVYSRFRNAAKHQLWISYRSVNNNNNQRIVINIRRVGNNYQLVHNNNQPVGDNNQPDGNNNQLVGNNNQTLIRGYYCTCFSGAWTLGTCAHIASVLWFLGYAQHHANIRYPPTVLQDVILDDENRQPQGNDIPEII